jgi:hypothetical protein
MDSKHPSSSKKTAEAVKTQHKADPKQIEAKAITTQDETGVGPTVPAETKLATTEQGAEEIPLDANIAFETVRPKKPNLLFPKRPPKFLIISFDMLRERNYLKKKFMKLNTMPEN